MQGLIRQQVVKNGTICSLLGTQIFGVGLGMVATVSVFNVSGGDSK